MAIDPDSQNAEGDVAESTQEKLAAQVAHVTVQPGVYLMKDARGQIIYVGKARNLKKRLQSYFQKQRPHDPKTTVLLTKVAAFDTLVTGNEKEAFILESNLIKKHRPHYNINLKDDKRYPSLRLDPRKPYPNLTIVRKVNKDGALYFGPYSSSAAVRQTLKFIHKTFKLRKCRTSTFMNRSRPCLNYQMGLCLAPCCMDVPAETYAEIVKEVAAFLRGRTPALIRKVKRQMVASAEAQAFEKAAQLRDKMFALERTLEKQVTVTNDFKDRDVVGIVVEEVWTVITVLRSRSGFLQSVRHYFFDQAVGTAADQMRDFLLQFYAEQNEIPPEIVVSALPSDATHVEEWLCEKKGRKVVLVDGQRGDRAQLVRMAEQNAINELETRKRDVEGQADLLRRLRKQLQLQRLPRRIECFDNSTLGGTHPVAAMVVFEEGRPRPEAHRRYKLRFNDKPDDYAYMSEVIKRRFDKPDQGRPWPDLLLVDGGKGQINVAAAVLSELNLEGAFDLAGIAKKDPARGEQEDKIYLPQRSNPVQFGPATDLLLFMQRIRDEAHRWAIGFQRQQRSRAGLHSALDDIHGIGFKRKTLLLAHFGGVEQIRAASVDKLCEVPGITPQLAAIIHQSLSRNPDHHEGG
jgi:excinuclease ABC subunit C